MKTILVPTDGSLFAIKALNVALDLTRAHHATIKLLHVLMRGKEPVQLLRLPELVGVGPDTIKELKRLHQSLDAQRSTDETTDKSDNDDRPVTEPMLRLIGNHVLERAEARVTERGVIAEVLDLADGRTGPVIVDTAETIGADVIVMGTRGLGETEAARFGSVFQEVCRTASLTCIAVH